MNVINVLVSKLFGAKKKGPVIEPVPTVHCPKCRAVAIRDGDSGSTGEARYFCLTCNDHFFHGGWGSGNWL